MAKTRHIGGAVQVNEARRLFEETGDYQYVALAIGASVNDPPKWALIECLLFRKLTQSQPALATSLSSASRILDRAIELIIEHDDRQRDEHRALRLMSPSSVPHLKITPLPRETALKRALVEIAPERNHASALEILKKAWQREEEEELVDWEYKAQQRERRVDDDTDAETEVGSFVEGYLTTFRVERAINRVEARKHLAKDPSGPWVEDANDLIFWARLVGAF